MSVFEELRRIIARVARCGEADITPETALKDIKADSLHWVQIIVGAENCFNVEIDVEKIKTFQTLADFAKYIEGITKK